MAQRNWSRTIGRMLRHRWMDESDTRKAIPPELSDRLLRRVAASEKHHTGEIRICVEASLPTSYLWRDAAPRERALAMFGKLGVWDTEHNNGVLIYLLLAERAIEIVADRGLNSKVDQRAWDDLATRLGGVLAQGRFEDGLNQALDEVTSLLVHHFALVGGVLNANELPDAPVLR